MRFGSLQNTSPDQKQGQPEDCKEIPMNEIREATSSMESGANQSFGAYKNIWSEHGSRRESGIQSQNS